jgi:RNA polymerase sigma-70 factor (ECF subfamily)
VLVARLGELKKNEQEREAKLERLRQSRKVIKRTSEDAEDVRLMELVIRGDTGAFAKLRKRHEGLVERTVRAILKSNSAVDAITGDVFIQVWKDALRYAPTAKFTTWLTEVAKNLALNEKKRAKKEKERIEFAHIGEDDSTEGNATPGGSEGDSEKDAALRALGELPPRERRIIEARFGLDGSKPKDRQALADELGITALDVQDLEEKAQDKMRRQFMSL